MASALQAAPHPHTAPSFSRNNTSSSMNGLQLSQSQLGSFDASQSVASTPAATPPPRAPSQQHSFNMGGNGMMNGSTQRTSFGSYPEVNGYGSQLQYPPGGKPQIYTAVYSSVSVYEMEVNGVAVMRRRSDSWLNATQILKVAGVEKGKRTKVLEKEILSGEHEKVQGGYGKYQGTWINYKRGVEFCRQYGVEDILRPLLEYDVGSDGMAGAHGGMETPTKEQAMAAQRKRLYNGMDSRQIPQSSNGTFFKSMSREVSNAVQTLNKTTPSRELDGRRSMNARRPSSQMIGSQESMYLGGSQQSLQSMASENGFSGSMPNNGSFVYGSNFADFPSTNEIQEPPRKRMKPADGESFLSSVDPNLSISMQDATPTEPNDSFYQSHDTSFFSGNENIMGAEPLPPPRNEEEERKLSLLMEIFTADPQPRNDYSDHPAFLALSGDELDMPIDASGNTTLHWAATLARIPLVRQLIARGSNIYRVNNGGETALMCACNASNNMEASTFPELLDLLGASMEVRCRRGRTLLHHITVSSAIRGRSQVGKYYLESLLEFLVRQSGSQESSMPASGHSQNRPLTFTRFMAELVNVQDKSGDTALNLAARVNTKSIVQQLLEVGANPRIANKGGLAPVDFGIGEDSETKVLDGQVSQTDGYGQLTSSSQTSFADTQTEILTSIREIFAASQEEFASESREKQDVLDQLNSKIRDSSTVLNDDRRRLEDLQRRANESSDLDQKIANLRRSAAELRNKLTQPNGHGGHKTPIDNVLVGEADKGLDLDGTISRVDELFPAQIDPGLALGDEQAAFLNSLERPEILGARVNAYKKHNDVLEGRARQLKSRSNELEERYRKMVSLCTGVEEEKVDEMLGSLVQAVMSEQSERVELGRVRDFLRMVQGVDA